MNLEEAKKTLENISQSTATKNPKVLILELCNVIKYLLEQVDVIDLSRLGHHPETYGPEHTPPIINPLRRSPPIINPSRPFRKGNAGDAE